MPDQELPRGVMYGGVEDTKLHSASMGGAEDNPVPPIREMSLGNGTTDELVPLQGMIVRLPNDPILVNNEPFDIAVDKERLAEAVNINLRPRGEGSGRFEPRILEITLGESLPPRFVTDPRTDGQPIHSYKDNGFYITAPVAVAKPGVSPEVLALQVAHGLNRDLRTGMAQNEALQSRLQLRSFAGNAAVISAAVSGEALGIIVNTDSSISERLMTGSAGAVVALAGMSLILKAGEVYRQRAYGNQIESSARKANKKITDPYHQETAQSRYFEEDVITLVPTAASKSEEELERVTVSS